MGLGEELERLLLPGIGQLVTSTGPQHDGHMLLDERMEQALPFRLLGVEDHDAGRLRGVAAVLQFGEHAQAQCRDVLVEGEELRDLVGRGFGKIHKVHE